MEITENVDELLKRILENDEVKEKIFKFVKAEFQGEEETSGDGGFTKIFKTLFKIFIIDREVIKACSDWRDKGLYIGISGIMRIVMLLQLPAIVQSFSGGI